MATRRGYDQDEPGEIDMAQSRRADEHPASTTRRTLLHAAASSALAAAAAGCISPAQGPRRSVRGKELRGVCRLCRTGCGVLALVDGARLLRVRGDPSSPTRGFICASGLCLPDLLRSPRRVGQPLLRQARGRLGPVSWEEALAFLAREIEGIRARWGARSIGVLTGWALVDSASEGFYHRLCDALGSPNYFSVSSLCRGATSMAQMLCYGRLAQPDMESARSVLLWGSNPFASNPRLADALLSKPRTDRHLAVVDPRPGVWRGRAELCLQLLPGTDLALALALAGLLLQKLRDDGETPVAGAADLDLLDQACAKMPPSRAAAICGLPEASIHGLSKLLAAHRPVALLHGVSLEHQRHGLRTLRVLHALPALSRDLGRPGGMLLLPEPIPAMSPRDLAPRPRRVADASISRERFPLFEELLGEAQLGALPDAVLHERPYPMKALIVAGSNPRVTGPGGRRLREALKRLELLVVVDPMLSRSAAMAHVVLPTTFFPEASEALGRGRAMALRKGWLPAPPGVVSDFEVCRLLARAFGLGRYFPWRSLTESLAAGHQMLPPGAGRGLPGGRLSLAHPIFERLGLDPTLRWEPLGELGEWDAWLVCGARETTYINSQLHGLARASLRMPRPLLRAHPELLSTRKVAPGQAVRVWSAHGEAFLVAAADDSLDPRVVYAPHGFPYAELNSLTDPQDLDPMSGFPALRRIPCRIGPA